MTVITERQIDKIKYLVVAKSSDAATDSIEEKIKKLIIKDLSKMPPKIS